MAKEHPNILYDLKWNLSPQFFDADFFIKLHDLGGHLNWPFILSFVKFSKKEEFLRKLSIFHEQDDNFWKNISFNQRLSSTFILDFKNKLDWSNLCSTQKFNKEILLLINQQPYISMVDWKDICIYQNLEEDIIDSFLRNPLINLSWNMISIHQDLDENLLNKYSNYLNWRYVSEYQKLSEQFIENNWEKLEWNSICKYQKLSINFIKYICMKYSNSIISKLEINNLINFQNYSEEEKNDLTKFFIDILTIKVSELENLFSSK
jgi:cell fate (sporulation/competence/biofilm development) regulator YmcA (YheA/YmcA/DUF963 family)